MNLVRTRKKEAAKRSITGVVVRCEFRIEKILKAKIKQLAVKLRVSESLVLNDIVQKFFN